MAVWVALLVLGAAAQDFSDNSVLLQDYTAVLSEASLDWDPVVETWSEFRKRINARKSELAAPMLVEGRAKPRMLFEQEEVQEIGNGQTMPVQGREGTITKNDIRKKEREAVIDAEIRALEKKGYVVHRNNATEMLKYTQPFSKVQRVADLKKRNITLPKGFRRRILPPCPAGTTQAHNESVYPHFYYAQLAEKHDAAQKSHPEYTIDLKNSHPDRSVYKRLPEWCETPERAEMTQKQRIAAEERKNRRPTHVRQLWKDNSNITQLRHREAFAYFGGTESTKDAQLEYLKKLYAVDEHAKEARSPKDIYDRKQYVVLGTRLIHSRTPLKHQYWLYNGPVNDDFQTDLEEEPRFMTENDAMDWCTRSGMCGGFWFEGDLSREKKWVRFKTDSAVEPWALGKESNIHAFFKRPPIISQPLR